jgi:peptidoglycan/LPS O-acetylase OafA/YrhL
MPEPVGRGQRYMPGLDGLRALAVLAVVANHLDISWAPGGLLGVGVFFTLSGYLITDLLLGQWESDGRLKLGDFWLRRARRLLPALFLMLAVVVIWVALADRSELGPLRGDAGSAAVYVNNWWLILHHVSYFARFGPPSSIGNLWSLAVEEQFYLVWPWLLWLGLLVLGSRRTDPSRRNTRKEARRRERVRFMLALVTLSLAILSAVEMAVLYHPSFDPTRVYDGTDTRAFGLLFGAALAMLWPSRRLRAQVSIGARRTVDAMGVVGLVAIMLLVWRTDQYSSFLYRGGMVLLSLATVLVLVAATHPASNVGRALGWQPFRWIGVRSYGIYLWHYPIIILTTATVMRRVDLPRAALQVGASIGVAALSWRFVESPIRQGALGRFVAQLREKKWRPVEVPARSMAASAGVLATIGLCMAALAGAIPATPAGTLAAANNSAAGVDTGSSGLALHSLRLPPNTTTTLPPTTTTLAPSTTTLAPSTTAPPSPTDPSATLRTSCQSVVHIGDSTSESLVSPEYLPDSSERLQAQYARVGVTNSIMEIQGATSIVETLPGEQNAYQVAQGLISQGYNGCWVIALGTNDTADVYVGSNVSMAARIQRMMSLLGNQPVLWVNVLSLLNSGPYSEANMQQWDQALVQACPQYQNMRVFDWASVAQPGWFISDGIHYNSTGSAARAAAIANALAQGFPASGQTTGSVGRSGRGSGSQGCVVQ